MGTNLAMIKRNLDKEATDEAKNIRLRTFNSTKSAMKDINLKFTAMTKNESLRKSSNSVLDHVKKRGGKDIVNSSKVVQLKKQKPAHDVYADRADAGGYELNLRMRSSVDQFVSSDRVNAKADWKNDGDGPYLGTDGCTRRTQYSNFPSLTKRDGTQTALSGYSHANIKTGR